MVIELRQLLFFAHIYGRQWIALWHELDMRKDGYSRYLWFALGLPICYSILKQSVFVKSVMCRFLRNKNNDRCKCIQEQFGFRLITQSPMHRAAVGSCNIPANAGQFIRRSPLTGKRPNSPFWHSRALSSSTPNGEVKHTCSSMHICNETR